MLTPTLQALRAFDNSHDFERMCADVLNSLGYADVSPVSPGGGSDGGKDICFMEGSTPGVAFVTLEKEIIGKFKKDLNKLTTSPNGIVALFCNVNITPANKFSFTKDAIAKGYRLKIFDLERLRSLLDTSLVVLRRRYLKIEDSTATQIRSEVAKYFKFPDAVEDDVRVGTMLESMFTNKAPRRVFNILLKYNEKEVKEVPEIGQLFYKHLVDYHEFIRLVKVLEDETLVLIGKKVTVRIGQGWKIYLQYALMRFSGHTQQSIIDGVNFRNYDITWEDAERVFAELAADTHIGTTWKKVFKHHDVMIQEMEKLRTSMKA